MTLFRRAAVLTAPVLLAFSLTACGGGDDGGGSGGGGGADEVAEAPSDASTDDFCGVFEQFLSDADDIDEEDTDAVVEVFQDLASQLSEVGTPEDMPADARQGFEVLVQRFSEVDEADAESEEDPFQFSGEDEQTTMAFQEYAASTCDIQE